MTDIESDSEIGAGIESSSNQIRSDLVAFVERKKNLDHCFSGTQKNKNETYHHHDDDGVRLIIIWPEQRKRKVSRTRSDDRSARQSVRQFPSWSTHYRQRLLFFSRLGNEVAKNEERRKGLRGRMWCTMSLSSGKKHIFAT